MSLQLTLKKFPDYEALETQADNYDGPPIDSAIFSQKIAAIGRLGKSKAEEVLNSIYALILHHSILTNKPVKQDRPALGGNSCVGGNGIIYKLTPENFDVKLQIIIYLYLISVVSNSDL
jgi:hypothetical protein